MNERLSELCRIKRVADMLCTGHAGLRDRYRRYSTALDLFIFGLSTWLLLFLFADPEIAAKLTPFHLTPRIWLGIIAFGTFCLSIVQIKVDWKAKSDAHKRSLLLYTEVKAEAGRLLAAATPSSDDEINAIAAKYYSVTSICADIPEKEFVRQKKRHLTKVEISKFLDEHPGASPRLLQIRLWWRDNVRNAAIAKK